MNDTELNEAVARKMGFDVRNGGIYWEEVPDDVQAELHPMPDYCHSIAAAWEIVKHLKPKFIVNIGEYPDHAFCLIQGFVNECYVVKTHEKSDTAPMAICLAFLKLEDK